MVTITSFSAIVCLSIGSLATGFVLGPISTTRRRRTQCQQQGLEALPSITAHSATLVSDAIHSTTTFSNNGHVLLANLLLKELDPETAKPQFFFLFFAGSGAGGIGLSQIPKIVSELNYIKALADQGPTSGTGNGDEKTLSTSPFYSVLYPKPLYIKDVQRVIQKIPSSTKINQQGKSESYFASLGYVVQEDFFQAMKGCNPLAVYAAFEALSGGGGKCINPDQVDEKVQTWRMAGTSNDAELSVFAADLQKATISKLSAYGTLFFLLFVTLDLIVETGINAFL